jgi:hypothetical protein
LFRDVRLEAARKDRVRLTDVAGQLATRARGPTVVCELMRAIPSS